MHFLDNPFFILNAKPCDNDARIVQLANERGLFEDPNRCRDAKAILMNPRKRIEAEIAWLPAKTREQAMIICESLESFETNVDVSESLRHVEDFLGEDELIPIAKCNVLATGLRCLTRYSPDAVATWTLEIASAYKDIYIEQVSTVINADRGEADIPIANQSDIGNALRENQARYYRQVITSAMDQMSVTERAEAMTRLVVSAIADDNQLSPLITTLGALYEKDEEVRESLEEHDTKVCQLVGRLQFAADRNYPDLELERLVNQLIREVKHWDVIAQPIQLSKTSQGSTHDESEILARRVQNLAEHLRDAHDKLDFCMQLIRALQRAFEEVNKISKRLREIMDGLNRTAQERERCARRKIESQIRNIRASVNNQPTDSDLSLIVDQLIQSVKNWKPSTRLCENYYADFYFKAVVNLVKKLADDLSNEHGMFDVSRQLREMLQEELAQDGGIVARVDERHNGLEVVEDSRAKSALEKIERHVKKLRACADAKNLDSNWDRMLNELIQFIKVWKLVAKPIEDHFTDYSTVMNIVVEFAFQLRIAHSKVDFSRQLFKTLQEEFTDVRGYATSIAKYSQALEDAERTLGRITNLDKELRLAVVAEIPDMVNQLIRSVKEWKGRAQPIKVYYDANYSMGARLVTDLALDLQSKPCRFDDSLKLIKMLHEEFAEVDDIAADVAEALEALEAAESARRHIENQVEKLLEVVYRKHRKHNHPDLKPSVDQLIRTVRGWRDLALPIKTSCGDYCSVAKRVLDLAKKLWKKGKRRSSGQLRDMVQDIFGEIPEIETLLAEEAKEREETERKYTHPSTKKRARWRR